MLAQSSSSGSSTVFNVLAFAGFLVVVAAFAFAIAQWHKVRHRIAWRPVMGLVGGRFEPESNARTSIVRGTWQGHPVICTAHPSAELAPRVDDPIRYNRFTVRLPGVPGGADWRLVAPGREGWRVEAADPTLVAALTAAGLAQMASGLRLPHDQVWPGIAYSARQQHLELVADAGRLLVPLPAQFRALLDALVTVAGINAAVNPPVNPPAGR